MSTLTHSVKKTTESPCLGILNHGNYDLTIRWICVMSTEYPHHCPGQAGATRAGGGSNKPSCLGETGEIGARMRRPSHNDSSLLQSLKTSEASRNLKKKCALLICMRVFRPLTMVRSLNQFWAKRTFCDTHYSLDHKSSLDSIMHSRYSSDQDFRSTGESSWTISTHGASFYRRSTANTLPYWQIQSVANFHECKKNFILRTKQEHTFLFVLLKVLGKCFKINEKKIKIKINCVSCYFKQSFSQ